MEQRVLRRTGLRVSASGYGAGREGSPARAFGAGIPHVDTVPLCGNGEAERKSGRMPGARLGPDTRPRLPAEARGASGALPA